MKKFIYQSFGIYRNKFLRKIFGPTLTGGIGFIFFVIVFGVKIFEPSNIGWLMTGDAATHFIGWHFFRNEDWHFPPGLISRYGMEISASVVYSDSIPLMAFIFKPFSQWLPDTFQYTGIWIALCYFLQGFFAYVLMRNISGSFIIRILGTGFFILSPIILFRGGGHFSLMAHWLILAGFVLYFSTSSRGFKWRWSVLTSVAVLIHAYLAVMVLAIWTADLYRRYGLYKIMSTKEIAIEILTVISLLISVMWLAGYFLGGGISGGGSTLYSMNLLAPFLPTPGVSSLYLPNHLAATPWQYEGFNYLGFGLILLLPVSLYLAHHHSSWTVIRKFIPLIGVCLVLAIYSLSYKITLGSNVFVINLPPLIEKGTQIFRASGRMFWPSYYLIIICSIALIVTRCKTTLAAMLLGFALIIQFTDFSPLIQERGMDPKSGKRFDSPLIAKFWSEAGRHYKRVIVVPPVFSIEDFIPITYYSSTKGMEVNIAYYGRPPSVEAERRRFERITDLLIDGRIDMNALYIFRNVNLINLVESFIDNNTAIGMVDGQLVMAPGWHGIEQSSETRELFRKKLERKNYAPLESDSAIYFNAQESKRYTISGFSHNEASGTWTDNNIAVIGLRLEKPVQSDWHARFEVQPFVLENNQKIDVKVVVNGQAMTIWHFEYGQNFSDREVVIPRSVADKFDGNLVIAFNIMHASSSDLSIGSDPRPLGLKFASAKFSPL